MPRGYFDEIGAEDEDDLDDEMGGYDEFGAEFGADFGEFGPPGEFGARARKGDRAASLEEDIVVGIPPTVFAGAGTATIICGITQPFRADRLILDPATQALATIEQINISSVDQNRGDGGLPGDLFTADARHRLAGTIADPGVGIALRVTMSGAGTFRGSFFGPARPLAEVARQAGKFDKVVCGIPLTTIGAGLTATITMNPTQVFRAHKLVVNAAGRVAGVTIDQISISSNDQNRANGAGVMPAELFPPNATHHLRGTVVRPGVGVKMTVTNGSAGAIPFGGAFFGPVVARP